MTNWPTLYENSTLADVNSPQIILTSIHGRRLGISSTGAIVTEPHVSSTSASAPSGTMQGPRPLRPEAGSMNTATTADVIGNYGNYLLSSTATPAAFNIAPPVTGSEVRLQFSCAAATAVKLSVSSSDTPFASSSTSFSLNINSSLFFADYGLTLQGGSTGQYRVMSYFSRQGSTILPTYATG